MILANTAPNNSMGLYFIDSLLKTIVKKTDDRQNNKGLSLFLILGSFINLNLFHAKNEASEHSIIRIAKNTEDIDEVLLMPKKQPQIINA